MGNPTTLKNTLNSEEYLTDTMRSILYTMAKSTFFQKIDFNMFYSSYGYDLSSENRTDLETALSDYV